nr:sensor histidine kinase [uncultured Agathobaculum sp.]
MRIADIVFWVLCCLLGGIIPACTARRFLAPSKGRIRSAVPCVTIGAALGMPTWVGDGNPLYFFPFFIAAFLVGYGGSRLARLVIGVIFYEWIIAWSMIVDTRAVLPGTDGYWGAVVWKLAMWLAVWLVMRRVLRDGGRIVLSGRLWLLIGLLSLAPLLSELAFSLWNIRFYTGNVVSGIIDAAFYTLLPFQFISAIALLFAIVLLSRHQALEQEHQLADMRELYYQGIRREQEQVRRLRHDMRNHLTVLSGLLAQGNTARAAAYVDSLQAASDAPSVLQFGENETANIVLSAKLREMEQAGLTADLRVSLPEKLAVADVDLCALIGNALDNAMEAARLAEDKRVLVRARADKGMLMLRVVNAYAGMREPNEAGVFNTTKADWRAHGFGLRGMREIAERYGGTLEATAADGRFELVACLPLGRDV